jgi:hypothetical protein
MTASAATMGCEACYWLAAVLIMGFVLLTDIYIDVADTTFVFVVLVTSVLIKDFHMMPDKGQFTMLVLCVAIVVAVCVSLMTSANLISVLFVYCLKFYTAFTPEEIQLKIFDRLTTMWVFIFWALWLFVVIEVFIGYEEPVLPSDSYYSKLLRIATTIIIAYCVFYCNWCVYSILCKLRKSE